MSGKRMVRPRTRSHSLRCTDELWARTQRRAQADGVVVNTVITELLEGYSRGLLDLPKTVKTYTPAKQVQVETESKRSDAA